MLSEPEAPFRTGWLPNCGWPAQLPWSRHGLCSMSLCLGSTGASAFPRRAPSQRSDRWTRSYAWNRFGVSSTAATVCLVKWLGLRWLGSKGLRF